MLQPAYSVLEQAAQREAPGAGSPFPMPFLTWGARGRERFPGASSSGKLSREQGLLECWQPLLLSWKHLVGGGVSKPRQIILTTSPPYWEGEGEINLPTFMLAFTWFRTFCQIVWKMQLVAHRWRLGALGLMCLRCQGTSTLGQDSAVAWGTWYRNVLERMEPP